jgi:hypothetical protein
VYAYHIINHSGHTLNETNIIINPYSILYGPVTNNEVVNNGDTSTVHTLTIYNAVVGQTLCFRARVHEIDSMGHELFCCSSDSHCITMPPCPVDSNCCGYTSINDSFWCAGTDSLGHQKYGFRIIVNGCGLLDFQPQFTTTFSPANPITLGTNTLITGTFINTLNSPNFSATFVISHATIPCTDITLQFALPPCDSICFVHYQDSICVGQTSIFSYTGNAPLGSTFAWSFSGGTPSSAVGAGPHTILYNTAGCHPYTLTITKVDGSQEHCSGQICVFAVPVASIVQSGNTLNAFPAGNTYQWYNGGPFTPISGEINQFFTPNVSDYFCVVVTNPAGCKDTACIDFIPNGIQTLESLVKWELYPNPNNGQFVLALQTNMQGMAEIEVSDAVGNIIYNRSMHLSRDNKMVIQLSEASAGVYFVKLRSAQFTDCKRVLIQ